MGFSENHPSLGVKEALSLFLFSWQVLFLEVLSTRIFSFILFHHFGFMAISVALLGFAGAGSWLSLKAHPPDLKKTFFKIGVFSSLSIIVSFLFISRIPFSVHPLLILEMLVLYLLLLVPFFLWGLGVALSFRIFAWFPGKIYFWNLLGSALGALSVFWLLPRLGAEKCLALGAGLCLIPGIFYLKDLKYRWFKLALPLLLVLGGWFFSSVFFPFSPFRDKILSSYLRKTPGTKLEFSRWFSPNRIDIVDTPKDATVFKNPIKIKALFQDGQAPAIIFNPSHSTNPELILKRSAWAVAYWPDFHPEKVLVIGPGGGADLQVAIYWGAKEVLGIEVNQGLLELMKSKYDDFTGGIFHHPRIKLLPREGRHWLKSTKEKYDLIQLSGVDTSTAISSGAYTLVESYLYTVEAFKEFYLHLTDSGRLCISRYLMIPPRESLRLCVLAIKALRELGIKNPSQHIIAFYHNQIFSLIIQKKPFSKEQISRLKSWLKNQDWQIEVRVPVFEIYQKDSTPRLLWYPGMEEDGLYVQLFKKSLEGREDEFIRRYPFDITPVRDDNPYFFKYSLFQLRIPGSRILIGQVVVLAQILQGIIIGLILILIPARRIRREPRVNLRPAWYFFGLGFGYLFIEIVLIQKLSLTLGHPFYAIGIVIPALLGFSGLGSWSWERTAQRFSRLPLLLLLGLLVIYFIIGNRLLELILPLAFPLRVLGCLGFLFPLGFLMGMPFPIGLRIFAQENQPLISWFWAVNGVCSVVASCLVVLISMHLGFSWVWALAIGFYFLAFLFIWR